MKAMILVVPPKEYCNLLNGDLTILVKRDKKLYVAISNLIKEQGKALIYAYCTKGKVYARPYLVKENDFNDHMAMLYDKDFVPKPKKFELYDFKDGGFSAQFYDFYGGKIVARFWCNNVEEIIFGTTLYNDLGFFTCYLHDFELYKQSCLTKREMQNYLKVKPNGLSGYAIHITNLEIFDKPKEIKEFHWYRKQWIDCGMDCQPYVDEVKHALTCAPRSGWCYVEV